MRGGHALMFRLRNVQSGEIVNMPVPGSSRP